LKTDGPTLADQLQADGVEAGWIADANAIVTPSASGLFNSGPFKRGMCQPQDLTAMKPVRAMNLASGQCVLDLCAGLGTKATQMAEAMGDTGAVLASDVNPAKLEQLCNNCSRLGLSSVHTFAPDQIAAEVSRQGRLDWILVDAPCSNTGVLSRRVEARYRLKPAEISTLQTTQIELLDLASDLARPETKIMYSTCSVEPEENIDAVHTFLERRQGWKLDRSHLSLPSASGELKQHQDGGFWAILLPAG
jgi:16S rRNA (cytosine967-C5)-methyltransferase